MYLNMNLPFELTVGISVPCSEGCCRVTWANTARWSQGGGTCPALGSRISCGLWLYLGDCPAFRAASGTTKCSPLVL